MKLTKATIARLHLPPGKPEAFFWDDDLPGFGLRLGQRGGSWIVQYRHGAKQRRLKLGRLNTLDPDKARAAAKHALAAAGLGRDPQAEKAEARARAAITLGAVTARYLDRAASRQKPRSLLETRRHLLSHWRPLHGLALDAIERRHVSARLAELACENGPIAANRARAALSALFGWAMREGLAAANPVIGTNKPAEERARDRVLSTDELGLIWQATAGPGDHSAIVRLLMLTGQRREEVAAMRWQEIDMDRARWSLPAERTKNGLPHDVPLSPAALDVLRAVPRRAGRALVFGEGKGGFSGWSQAKARLDQRIVDLQAAAVGIEAHALHPLPPWRLHDLRRTVVTGMAELGIQPHVVEAVVNHVSGYKAGVAGIYNKATYAADKRAALERWAEHLTRPGAEVVRLRA